MDRLSQSRSQSLQISLVHTKITPTVDRPRIEANPQAALLRVIDPVGQSVWKPHGFGTDDIDPGQVSDFTGLALMLINDKSLYCRMDTVSIKASDNRRLVKLSFLGK